MAAKTSAWVAGTAVGALVIAAGAWFGAIEPTLADASEQRQTAADQRDRNDMLTIQLERLKADAANLETYRAELADLRVKVPTAGELAELTRQIQAVADATGVTVTVVSPGTPTAFIPATPVTPEPEPSETASTEGAEATPDAEPTGAEPTSDGTTSSDGTTTPEAAQAGAEAIDGLYAISLSISAVGTYAQTVAFVDQLQQAMPRLYVISGLNATSLEQSDESGGRPATNVGDLETVVTGMVLTLEDPVEAAQEGADAAEPPAPTPLPVPGAERNPFEPVGQPS